MVEKGRPAARGSTRAGESTAAAAAAALGVRGEEIAADYLERHEMVVLDHNWRCGEGELDLVALDGDDVVFVEVKTRSGTGFGLPAEAVSRQKANRIRKLAGLWLSEHRAGWAGVRFDVIGIVAPRSGAAQIEHYRGAF